MATPSPTAKSHAGSASAAESQAPQRPVKLPAYTRSLLKIEVPVVVTLAANRQSIRRILELGPGTLLHFNKPCDEPLSLLIGERQVAVGEAVKVGERFGLRITSMVLPEEKFKAVRGMSSPAEG